MPVPTSINYGQVASGYDKSRCVEPGIADAMVAGLRSLHAQSVLEIGAGTGNYTGALTEHGLSVVALDRSPAMIEIGADKTSAHWILSDASSIPLRTRSVDAIVAVNALHHLSDLRPLSPSSDASRASAPCCRPWFARISRRSGIAIIFPRLTMYCCRFIRRSEALSRRCSKRGFPASR